MPTTEPATLPAAEDYLDKAAELVTDARSSDNAVNAVAVALAEAETVGQTRGYNLANEAAAAQREIDGSLYLDPTQARELAALVFRMPYAGGLPSIEVPGWQRLVGPKPIDPARLLLWLEQLRQRLADAGEREQRLQDELYQLRGQRHAMREFLGLPTGD